MNNEQERYQANIDLLRKQAIESGLVKVEKIEQMRTDKSFGIEVDKHELSDLVLETIKILEPSVKTERELALAELTRLRYGLRGTVKKPLFGTVAEIMAKRHQKYEEARRAFEERWPETNER